MAVVIVLAMIPKTPDFGISYADKIAHFTEFFVLMVWFGGLYTLRGQLVAFVALGTLGVAIEFAQGLNIFRSFDIADMVANFTGLVAGLFSVRTWLSNWCARIEAVLI